MLKHYIQVDKQGNVLRPAALLPMEFKGQANFNTLSDAQVSKYGFYPTNVNSFQGQMAHAGYDEKHNIVFNDDIKRVFAYKYLETMKTAIWKAIAEGVNHLGYRYPYSYHHQMQTQNACLVGGQITRYKDSVKESYFHSVDEAKYLLRSQMDNMEELKREYNFYCERIKLGFDTPEEYTNFYQSFISAMSNEGS